MTGTKDLTTLMSILMDDLTDVTTRRLIAADLASTMGYDALDKALRRTETAYLFFPADPDSVHGANYYHLSATNAAPFPLAAIKLIKAIKKAVGNRKRAITFRIAKEVSLARQWWDEGNISYYWKCPIHVSPPEALWRFLDSSPYVKDHTYHIGAGVAIVEGGYQGAGECSLTIHLHPDDVSRFGLVYVPADPAIVEEKKLAAEELKRLEKVTKAAVDLVWQNVAPDIDEANRDFPGEYEPTTLEEAIEICLDASRPVTDGGMSNKDYDALLKLDKNLVDGWARESLRYYF